jgi:hypothetical protein
MNIMKKIQMERNKEKKNNKEDEFIKREINNNDKELNT